MTKAFGKPETAQILVIGHDPALQRSDTEATYALFADYYFRPDLGERGAHNKHKLAESTFQTVLFLTAGRVAPAEVLVTNLCNEVIKPRPKGKTVLIPKQAAVRGISDIERLLSGSSVRVILAMSQQVNYWLQDIGFCDSDPGFLAESRPLRSGLDSSPQYYEPQRQRAFLNICCRSISTKSGRPVFPVLHARQWPLTERTAKYRTLYAQGRKEISQFFYGNAAI